MEPRVGDEIKPCLLWIISQEEEEEEEEEEEGVQAVS
jgi:hypothetical protein